MEPFPHCTQGGRAARAVRALGSDEGERGQRAAHEHDVGRVHRGDAPGGDEQAAQRRTAGEGERLVGGGDGDGAGKDLARHQGRQQRGARGISKAAATAMSRMSPYSSITVTCPLAVAHRSTPAHESASVCAPS